MGYDCRDMPLARTCRSRPGRELLFGLLLAAVALAGCASQPGRWQNEQTPADDDPHRPVASAWHRLARPTTQPEIAVATRPDGAAASTQLDLAVMMIARLEYARAQAELVHLEGRLLLARDIKRASEAAFWLAFCSEKLGLIDQAAVEYARVLERYPETPQADTAADRLTRLRPIPARPVLQ